MSRKTADVADILDNANDALENSGARGPLWDNEEKTQGWRAGICTMIEEVLHEAGQYNGFTWIDEDGTPLPNEEQETPSVGEDGYYLRRYHKATELQE